MASGQSVAHEIRPAVADLSIKSTTTQDQALGRLVIIIDFNIEMFLADLDASVVSNTDDAQQGEDYDAYRRLSVADLSLQFKKLDKQLPVRISYPVGRTRFPVIVFSHGNGSKGDMYKGFTDYWASHGYVVIQPTHMDSLSLGFKTKRDNMREMYQQMLQVTDTRRQDMSFIVDSLDLIETIVPDLKDKLDRTKLVAAVILILGGDNFREIQT